MEKAHIEEINGKLSPMGGTPSHKQWKSGRHLPPEEEALEETTCDEIITAPIPCLPRLLAKEEAENSGVTLSLQRKKICGKVF